MEIRPYSRHFAIHRPTLIFSLFFSLSKTFLGQSNVTARCDAGHFCTTGAVSPTPSDPKQGGICPSGSYCPIGSPSPIKCDPGKYCPNQGLHVPYANCSAGFYCWLGSKSPRPDDNSTGNACPEGAYCLEGSHNITLCPPGTFSNSTNNTRVEDCLQCSMGSYCAGWGNPNPTGLCDPGFHCPEGQLRADPPSYRCPVGHYCPRGSENGIQCTSGFYQDELQQENCKVFVLYYSCNWAIPEIKCNPPC